MRGRQAAPYRARRAPPAGRLTGVRSAAAGIRRLGNNRNRGSEPVRLRRLGKENPALAFPTPPNPRLPKPADPKTDVVGARALHCLPMGVASLGVRERPAVAYHPRAQCLFPGARDTFAVGPTVSGCLLTPTANRLAHG